MGGRKKDGSEGSMVDIPPVEVMQRDPRFRSRWILYSSYDAVGTYKLREVLEERLKKRRKQLRKIILPVSQLKIQNLVLLHTKIQTNPLNLLHPYLHDFPNLN